MILFVRASFARRGKNVSRRTFALPNSHFRGFDRPLRALPRRPHFARFWPFWFILLCFRGCPTVLALKFLFKTVQNVPERSENSVFAGPHFADFPAHTLPIGSAFARVSFRVRAHRANRARTSDSPVTLALFWPFLPEVRERGVCVFCARTHESRRPKNSPARPSKISIFGDPQKSPKSALFGLFEKRSKTRKIPGNPKKFAAERGCSRPLPRAHPRKTEGVEPCARAGTRAGSQRSKSHKTRQVRVSRIPGGARPWRVTRAHTRARAKMACANLGGGRDSPLAGSGWGRVCPKQRENQNLKRP